MTVCETVDVLNVLGCPDDPIEYAGRQLTPRDLPYEVEHSRCARTFVIRFFVSLPHLRFVEGSIAAMVLDRLGYLARERPRVRVVTPMHGSRRTQVRPIKRRSNG